MESSRALCRVAMRSGLDCQVWMCATTEIPIRLCLAISETATTTLPASEFATAAVATTVGTSGTHRKCIVPYQPLICFAQRLVVAFDCVGFGPDLMFELS